MSIDFEARARAAGEPPPTNGAAPPDWSQVADFRAPKGDAKGKSALTATSPRDVLKRWKTSGPLVHEPTGFTVLDERTGGGFVYGSRVYFLGAPDAGKTAFIVHLADVWGRRGVVVGLLAVDEEDDDVTTRLVQRLALPPVPADLDMNGPLSRDRFTRQDCERRAPNVIQQMLDAMGDPPVRFYSADWTIEAAAADLDKYAASVRTEDAGRRVALFIDSIQTVSCAGLLGLTREPSPREVINANVRAVRATASRYRMFVGATSEMPREFYRSEKGAEEVNDIAGGKESGSIEYSGRILVSFRSTKDDPDLIQVRLPKNKHGPAYRKKGDEFYLRLNRATQTLVAADPPRDAERSAEPDAESLRRTAVLNLVAANPGRGTKALRELAKSAALRIGNKALDEILKKLISENAVEDRGTEDAHEFHVVPEGARHPSGTGEGS